MNDLARVLIKNHEGLRLKPYHDTVGKLTVGYGRNLEDVGISEDEADEMLTNDITVVTIQLAEKYSWFKNLDYIRQAVVIDMAYNLGLSGFDKFKKTISYIKVGNYEMAAREMLDSKWAKQVGQRARTLAALMENGMNGYPSE